jgi:hypothetical protein
MTLALGAAAAAAAEQKKSGSATEADPLFEMLQGQPRG